MITKRTYFFFISSIAAALMYFVAPTDLKYVPIAVSLIYLFVSFLSFLDRS